MTGDDPSRFKGENRPVETVSWRDVQALIQTLNDSKPDLDLCLPTEAQWEYACRAGTKSAYAFGDKIEKTQAQLDAQETAPVKSFFCNDWGLYDMHGNVWEWCADYGLDVYSAQTCTYPQGPQTGEARVLRGGGWLNRAQDARSASRHADTPVHRYAYIGFRLARGQAPQ